MRKARDEKLVRFLGVTGHADPAVLMEALRRFEFDTLLLALNAADPHHLSFAAELLPMAVEKKLGVIGMKIPARGRLLSASPSEPGITMREAMDYVLSLPVSTVIVGCDSVAQLEENVRLARSFNPLTEAQRTALTERAAPVHREALFFRRWT
jgi:predicted aldo/keto reductase-like oxidoreductase